MADLIPPMLIKLQADVNDLKTGLAKAETALKGVDDSVKTASTGMSNFVTKMKQVGATMGVAFAGTQIVQFGKDVIMAASNMNESLSKVQVVFSKSSESVIAWSETSATAMGMSKQAALEAAGTYGNLFQAFGLAEPAAATMSTSLVQLASDMASFNNTSIDEAILALRSGLSGETEPLKKFGVALSEARLKTEALALGLIKSTKEALTPAAKAQASYSLIMKDTILAQGDYSRTADGTANTMRTLSAQFENAKVALGQALLPVFQATLLILKPIVAGLTEFGKFLEKNSALISIFTGALVAGVAAFVAYRTIMVAATTAGKLFAVMQVIMTGGQLASIASTNTLAASMLRLNAVMKANPIGLIVTAIGFLVAGFVLAYKKSETFRNGVAVVAKAVLSYIAFMIRAWGDMITIILKVVTGPMKLFLTVIGKLPGMGNAAKAGLNAIKTGIQGVGNFAEKTAKKIEGLKGKVDTFTASANKAAKAGKGADKAADPNTVTGPTGGITAAEEKRLSKLKDLYEKIQEIYDDMQKVIDEAAEKAEAALEERNQKMLEAQERYTDQVEELNERYKETIANAEEAYADRVKDIKDRKNEADIAAQERYQETVANIEENYINKKLDLQQSYEEKITDLKASAADKTTDLIKNANEKQLSIVQQSIDRLRSAFASKTGFNIAESFKGGAQSADKLIDDLKSKLQAIKDLQSNAAQLAALGYSQVFIEEIVKQGPEAGNKIADALKAASPEATKELQSLYGQVENVSNNGLNDLAKTMNAGGTLATEELMNSYKQVSVDLAESLAKTTEDLNKNLADAQSAFNKSMAQNENERTKALAKASEQLLKALEDNQKTFDKAMTEAADTLAKTRLKAQEDLNKGLIDAQDKLSKALEKAQREYQATIDAINEDTVKKLEELSKKLKKAQDEVRALGGNPNVGGGAPVFGGITPQGVPGGTITGNPNTGNTTTATPTTVINTVFNTASVDASDVHLAVISATKFGNAVTIPQSATAAFKTGTSGKYNTPSSFATKYL
jgi:hypothetical protein